MIHGLLRASQVLSGPGLGFLHFTSWNPLEAFESVASSVRLSLIASVCLGFVLFRIVLRLKSLPRTWGLLSISAGGFLMSSGHHIVSGRLTGVLVAVGAGAFLCGLTILLRGRPSGLAARREGIGGFRANTQPASDVSTHSGDLAALAKGIGSADPVELPSTEKLQPLARSETSWRQYTAHRGAPGYVSEGAGRA